MKPIYATMLGLVLSAGASSATAQSPGCEIPREARDIWHCENGFVVGPENVIIRLPIPETDPEALYQAGLEGANRRDWRVAIAYFTAAHQRAHLVPRYMYNLGLAHARAGNAAAGIAWLVSYLIADPQAANRDAVWAEISQLEAEIHRNSRLLFEQAEAAANELPRASQIANDSTGARASGLFSIALAAAAVGDYDRARRIGRLGVQASLSPSTFFSDDNEIRRFERSSALANSDLAAVNALTAQIGSPPTGWGEPQALERLQSGGINSDFCGTFYMERFQNFVCPEFPHYVEQPFRDYERALRSGQRNAILAARARVHNNPANDSLTLALNGQAGRAASVIAAWDSEGFESNARETGAASVAEALLRTAGRGAEQFAASAQRYVSRFRGADGVTIDMWYSGWAAARARALLLAEQGHVDEAVRVLDIYIGSRLGSWSGYGTPQWAWLQARFDGLVTIAQYLIDRGRGQQAIPLLQRLDSLRRDRAAAAYPDLISASPGGEGLDAVRRRLIEQASILATTLPPVCYDLNWELQAIATGRGEQDGGFGPGRRVARLSQAASGLEQGLRRMRAVYERAGGTWGR